MSLSKLNILFILFFLSSNLNSEIIFEKGFVSIDNENNVYSFNVEIANDKNSRSYGLMYRKSLDKNKGMLFIYPKEKIVCMWMKNTFLALDIIFISNENKITEITKNNQPLELKSICSSEKVIAVLELLGGTSDLLDITVGSLINYELVKRTNK